MQKITTPFLMALVALVAACSSPSPDDNVECRQNTDCPANESCCRQQCIGPSAVCTDDDTSGDTTIGDTSPNDTGTPVDVDTSAPETDTAIPDTGPTDTTVADTTVTDTTVTDTSVADTSPADTTVTDTTVTDTTVADTTDASDTGPDADVSPGGLVLVDPGIHSLGGAVSASGILLIDAALDGTSRACGNNVCVIGGIGK